MHECCSACLQHFKAIGQSKSSRAVALVPSSKPLKVILEEVYRCDSLALRNWGRELGSVLKCLTDGQQQPKRSIVVRLQIEYLSCVVVDGQLLSLPVRDESVLNRVDNAKPSERSDMLLASPGEETYFVVVDSRRPQEALDDIVLHSCADGLASDVAACHPVLV